MIFGERLCQQRKAKGLSQEQFAEKLQVSRQAVSKWETGESQPDLAKLLMIRDILEVPLDDLCSDQPRPARSPQPAVNRSRGFNLFCVLTLIVGLLAGLAGGYLAFGNSAEEPAPTVETPVNTVASAAPVFDRMEISSLTFTPLYPSGDTSRTLQIVFSPSIARDDFSYSIVKTDSLGKTVSYDAEYEGGVCTCRVTANYWEGFILTAVVTDGTNTYSAGLIEFTQVDGESLSYVELWNQ